MAIFPSAGAFSPKKEKLGWKLFWLLSTRESNEPEG
jgi:hypothetical protein